MDGIEKAAIAAALIAVTVGAFVLLPPAYQPGYAAVGNFSLEKAAGPLNINTASAGQLMLLPGIGEKKAQAILEYRETHGDFLHLEEVASVPGISAKTIESWQGLAEVR